MRPGASPLLGSDASPNEALRSEINKCFPTSQSCTRKPWHFSSAPILSASRWRMTRPCAPQRCVGCLRKRLQLM
eukprot:9073162-Pyramimonas_sp.AAC.1